MQPISAPPTPVNPTHLIPIAMERCRSSEAALSREGSSSSTNSVQLEKEIDGVRDGRSRSVKATSLLFSTVPNQEEITNLEKNDHDFRSEKSTPLIRATIDDDDDKMDVDEIEVDMPIEQQFQIWGMPKWGWEEERKEVRPGVRLVGMEEVSCGIAVESLLTRAVWFGRTTRLDRHPQSCSFPMVTWDQ